MDVWCLFYIYLRNAQACLLRCNYVQYLLFNNVFAYFMFNWRIDGYNKLTSSKIKCLEQIIFRLVLCFLLQFQHLDKKQII